MIWNSSYQLKKLFSNFTYTVRIRLLILIDFSPYSETLIKLANTWGKVANADILFIHQVPALVPVMADSKSRYEIIEHKKEEALSKLKALVQKIDSVPDKITYQISEKKMFFPLPEFLKQGYNDLMLVGLKGTGLLKQIFIGSFVTKIIEDLNNTTVAIPVKLNNLIPEKFIVALNTNYPLNGVAFRHVLDFFNKTIKQIVFISVVTPSDIEVESTTYLNQLKDQYKQNIASSVEVFKGEDAFIEIKNYVQQNQNSILVVQKGSRSLRDQLFRKFISNEFVHDGAIPLIILPL